MSYYLKVGLGIALILGEYLVFSPNVEKQAMATEVFTNSSLRSPSIIAQTPKEMKTHPSDEFSQNLQLAALRIAQKIDDPHQKVEVLSQIAINYANFAQKEQALITLSQARTAAKAIPDLAARAKAMGELAGTYQGLFKEKTDEVEEILVEALDVATSIQEPSEAKNQALDEIAFRYTLTGQTQKALQIVDQMEFVMPELPPGVQDYPGLRESHTNFERDVKRQSILRITTRKKVEEGDYDGALELFQEENISSDERETSPAKPVSNITSSLNFMELLNLMEEYKQAGQTEQIEKLIAQVFQTTNSSNDPEQILDLKLTIGQHLVWIGWQERAIELLEQVFQATPTIEDPQRRNFLLVNLAQAFAQAGQYERALQIVQSMENAPDVLEEKLYSLIQIGFKVAESGEISQVNEVLERALELIPLMPSDDSSKAYDLISIAMIYLQSGQKEQASQFIEQVLQQNKNLDYETLDRISYLLIELGLYDRAFEIARSTDFKEDLSRLVDIYLEMGNYPKAFEVVNAIQSPSAKVEALTNIASSYIKSGYKERGIEIANQALEIARTAKPEYEGESDAEYRGNLIQKIASSYIELGEYDRILPEIFASEDPYYQTQVFYQLFTLKDALENPERFSEIFNQSLQVARNIPDTDRRTRTLNNINSFVARVYAIANRYDRALQIISTIKDFETQASALATLAGDYAEKKDRVDLQTRQDLQTILEKFH